MTCSRTLQTMSETVWFSSPMHFLQMVSLPFPPALPPSSLLGCSEPILGSPATQILTNPSVDPEAPNSPAQLREWKQLSGLGSWAGICRQPEAVAVFVRSPPSGPLEVGGEGGVSRADTQEHPSVPSLEKSPRDNIGPKFLISVAFVPHVTLPAPPVQKDLWLLRKTSLTSLVPPASRTGG